MVAEGVCETYRRTKVKFTALSLHFEQKGEIYTHDLAEIYEISPIVEMTERIILFSLASNDKITPHTDQ